jgi:hypothetical protein
MTVDQIASETGYKHSTVGYYVSIFNRAAKLGKTIQLSYPLVTAPEGSRNSIHSAIMKERFSYNFRYRNIT